MNPSTSLRTSLIDTHAHLDFEQFAGEEEATLVRAKEAGVDRIINVGTTLARSRQAVELAHHFSSVWASVGVHPHDAAEVTEKMAGELAELAKHPRVVAIGEIGFDTHYEDGPDMATQEYAFTKQVEIAKTFDLPLIVHSRDAEVETVQALRDAVKGWRKGPGVVHCFTGSQQFADDILALGFSISFTATITYPKNDALREVVKNVSLERLMVETDCPFLAPQDKRGQRNEPAYVVVVVKKIAELKGVSVDEITAATTRNAERLFGLR